MSVYIGNLSYEVKEDDLKQVFSEYGTVKSIQLPIDRETDRVRGFAFVEMESEAEEAAAMNALNNAEWMGRSLKVNKAKPKISGGSSGSSQGNSSKGGSY